MSSTVVVIAPHPDDETLGCGGTILKHKQDGDRVFWLIVTCISEEFGYSAEKVRARNDEIEHKNIAYESGATNKGIYTLMDKIIKTGSRIAINISEKI